MTSELLDYAGLGAALADKANFADGPRGKMLDTFKYEIATLMIGLRRAQVVGTNDRPCDVAEKCDLCRIPVEQSGLYVDGSVKHFGGMWANMCFPCFLERGRGLGWGVGQLYRHDGIGWQCIAGGMPNPREEEEGL